MIGCHRPFVFNPLWNNLRSGLFTLSIGCAAHPWLQIRPHCMHGWLRSSSPTSPRRESPDPPATHTCRRMTRWKTCYTQRTSSRALQSWHVTRELWKEGMLMLSLQFPIPGEAVLELNNCWGSVLSNAGLAQIPVRAGPSPYLLVVDVKVNAPLFEENKRPS